MTVDFHDLARVLVEVPAIHSRAARLASASAISADDARALLGDVEKLLRVVEAITPPVEVTPVAPVAPDQVVAIDPVLIEIVAAMTLIRTLLGPTATSMAERDDRWREARWEKRKDARASAISRWMALRDAIHAAVPRFPTLQIDVMPVQRFRTSKRDPWMTAIGVRVLGPGCAERRVVASLEDGPSQRLSLA